MKTLSRCLWPLSTLLALALFTFFACKRPCPCCETPVPIFTYTPDGILIKTDSMGPNLNVRLQVTSHPGGTLLFLDTIPAGSEQPVAIPDSVEQIRIRMDYLPANPKSRTKCVCPVDVIIDAQCREVIVMDVIIQRGNCMSCQNPAPYNSLLTIPPPLPSSNTIIYNFMIGGHPFDIEYYYVAGSSDPHKFRIWDCGDVFELENTPQSGDNVVTVSSGTGTNKTILFEVTMKVVIINNNKQIQVEVVRKAGNYSVGYCAP